MDKAFGSIALLTALSALAQLIGFGCRVVMARLAGAEVMGLYQLVMSAYGVIQAITTLGLTAAMSNLTARYLALGDHLGARQLRGTCLKLFFALMLPVGTGVILASDPISVLFLGDARTQLGLILLIPCLTLTGVENIHKNAFYGAARPLLPAVAEVLEQLVRTAGVLGLLRLFLPQYPERAVGLVMGGMILCEIFSALDLTLLYHKFFSRNRSGPGESRWVQLIRVRDVALPVGANALLCNLLGAVSAALIPRQLVRGGMDRAAALSELGVVCGMTLPMLTLPTVYLGALNLYLMPRMARACALGREEEIRRLVSRGMEGVCILTVPCMALMGVLGEELGHLLYGRRDVGGFLLPLALSTGMNCCVSVLASALNSIGRQSTVAGISLVGGAVQLSAAFLLMPRMGMGGYVAGVVLSTGAELLLCLERVGRYTRTPAQPYRWLIAPGLAGALSALNARLLLRTLILRELPPALTLPTVILFGLTLYLLALFALFRSSN